jgi:uncharacterized protein with NAD-binding domain and iron-sulfur cluster
MKRKPQFTPPPFVKEIAPKAQPVLKVRQTINETLPLETISQVKDMPLELQRNLLAKWEESVYALHTQYVEAIAIRDALALHVKTNLMKPHWTKHASVAQLHGAGANLIPCAKCGRMTAWSFDGRPQCTIFRDMVPTDASHAVCMVETGSKKWVTREERDVANILAGYGTEKKSPKKGKK